MIDVSAAGPPEAATLAGLAVRAEEQDERIRRIEATLRALVRFPAPAGGRSPAVTDTWPVATAATPAAIPWPVREFASPAPDPAAAAPDPPDADAELVRAALDFVPDAVVAVDADGAVRVWSRAAEELFGWPAAAVVGLPPPFLPADKHDEHAGLLRTVRAAGRIDGVATVRRRLDGGLVPVRVGVGASPCGGAVFAFRRPPPVLSDPPPPAVVVLPPDPTAERFATLGRAAAGVAHDFNNLLAVVHGHAELLAEQLAAGSPLRESADAIVTTAETAAGVSRQLLSVARPDLSAPARTDLNHLLDRIERLTKAVVGAKVTVTVVPAPDLPPARIHPSELTQVVLNLATNARDAMPGGGTLTIRTEDRPAGPGDPGWPADVPGGEFLVLTVADTGIGMDEETRLRVFDPLFTTKEGGAGVGLMAVRDIVARAGGHVEIASEPGRGTEVQVYLPLA